MKILTSEQMKNIDRRATEQFAIPGALLMENAARAVVDAVRERYPDADNVAIFCGPGRNGGDGLAAARMLADRGVTPLVVIAGDRSRYTDESAANLAICERLRLPMYDVADTDALDQALARASQTDLIVDAIFGTGLNRAPADLYADAIRGIQSLRLPIVAVDVPSGLNASSPDPFDPAIRADLTVTFALPKIAHIFPPAAEFCGDLIVADISIPDAAIESENVRLSVATPLEVAPLFAPRSAATHKGTYGHVGIVAGSEGRSGAAILSARGAIRGGAGLVTVLTDPDTARIVDAVSIESMTFTDHITSDVLSRFSAMVIGPGLADNDKSYRFIRSLISKIDQPMIVDASALNAFAGDPRALRSESHNRVITPHPGELARLLGVDTAEVLRRRLEIASEVASLTNCVVLLKGHQTLVADPAGFVSVNPTGNPGMASGGMGDVLSGLVGALLARGNDPFESAVAAAYLHGLAGDILRDETSDIGLAAMDVADALPLAVRKLR
jgi:hydroxyethylthiazole kinase-like uncharacterized protein yjeF